MTPQIFSIEHAPVSLPIWHTMMDDLCNPPPQRVARVLGLGLRTVQRYNATGYAPRHICLAIFWLTRWGRSNVNAQAVNDATLMASYVRGLTDHARALTSQIDHLLTIGNFGSANDPSQQPAITRRHHHALANDSTTDEPTPRTEQLDALMAHLSRLHQAFPGQPGGNAAEGSE
jgi:hypothetical protein